MDKYIIKYRGREKMKKVVIYFSDIMDTLIGNQLNTEEDYYQFDHLLATIKEKEQADEIIFALISTDNQEIVSHTHDLLTPFIGQTVTFGRQYFGNGYYTESEVVRKKSLGKPMEIIEYVDQLSQSYDVSSVYYVDDSMTDQMILSHIVKQTDWEPTLHSIRPTNRIGLSDTNRLLDENIQKTFGSQR